MDGEATSMQARPGQAHGMALRRGSRARLPIRREYSLPRFEGRHQVEANPAGPRLLPAESWLDFVPMVVTGHDTSVSSACHGSTPAVIDSAQVDAQGYQKTYWHKVSPRTTKLTDLPAIFRCWSAAPATPCGKGDSCLAIISVLSSHASQSYALLANVNLAGRLFHELTAIGVTGRRAGVDPELGLAARTESPHSASLTA